MMDPNIGNFISVGIGALVTLLGVFLSNWLLILKEREQWHREHKAEKEKWLRDKLQEIYSNCIYYLGYIPTPSPGRDLNHSFDQPESEIEYKKLKLGYDQLDLEFQRIHYDFNNEKRRWLNLLAVYHPFRGTAEFDNFLKKVSESKLSIADITELAARDPRLQSDIGKLGA